MSALGDELRRLRRLQHLNQADLAKKLGLGAASQISEWEKGHRDVSREHWTNLARHLGVTPEHLYRFGEPYDPSAPRRSAERTHAAHASNKTEALHYTGTSPTVAPTSTDEPSVRGSEAAMLDWLGDRGRITLAGIQHVIGKYPARAAELFDAVDDLVARIIGGETLPKFRRHSGGRP